MNLHRFLLAAAIGLLSIPAALAADQPAEERSWSLDLAFQQYLIPSERDIGIGSATLSFENFLLEGRVNYEARDSGSVWAGWAFEFGEEWEFYLAPMAGFVFGDLQGVAPGGKADITWRDFNFYSEMEYVFVYDDRTENFFYTWNELTYGVVDWLRIGIVGNRTRSYNSAVSVDRGPIVSVEIDPVTISCTVLNVDSDPIVIIGAEVGF